MKNTFLTRLFIVSACLFLAVNSQCVRFYADYDEGGDSFRLCSSGDVPSNWNDQVSSFVVPSGYTVKLYQDYGYGGQSYGPYSAGSHNVPSDFNDQLSSVRIARDQDQSQPDQNCPTFYDHRNLVGDSFQMCSSGDVPNQWNNKASSFVVPSGFIVYLYQHDDLDGDSLGPYTEGTYNIPDSFDNRLTSVRVNRSRPPSARNCPTFYRNSNQQGDSFQLCSSGNVPSGWDNEVSSFYVPRGYYVRLFEKKNAKGDCEGPYGAGSYNVPSDFNDELSSVVIRRR